MARKMDDRERLYVGVKVEVRISEAVQFRNEPGFIRNEPCWPPAIINPKVAK